MQENAFHDVMLPSRQTQPSSFTRTGCGKASIAQSSPRFQAGSHLPHTIALAVALLQAQSDESKRQQQTIIDCAPVLSKHLASSGYAIMGGGTDTHLVLIDVRSHGIEAKQAETILELEGIYCNQNYIVGDGLGVCSGIRLGTGSMVLRGKGVPMFCQIADFVREGLLITKQLSCDASLEATRQGLKAPAGFEAFSRYVGSGSADEKPGELRHLYHVLAQRIPPP